MKYHNITPPEFFDKYDRIRRDATEKGRAQTQQLVASGKFERFIGDSTYNTNELIDVGAPVDKCCNIAPFHRIHDFDKAPINYSLKTELEDGKVNLLFVGRVVPNKGHKHIISTLNSYVAFYGNNIRLTVVGSMAPNDNLYFHELENLINKYKLAELISFKNSVTFDDLNTYYKTSAVFLVMSEHEGFCVPILEAQYHNVPVIALDRGAISETLGPGQLIFGEPNYSNFAVGIKRICTDLDLRKALVDAGRQNFGKYEAHEILRQTLEVITCE